jgi:hypothetical protein
MEVSRKADSIMSLRLGRLSRNQEEACNQHLFFDISIQPVTVVSAKHGHKERCPLVGKYALQGSNNNEVLFSANNCMPGIIGSDHLMFGCTGEATEFNLVQNSCSSYTKTPEVSSEYILLTQAKPSSF